MSIFIFKKSTKEFSDSVIIILRPKRQNFKLFLGIRSKEWIKQLKSI